VEDRHKAIRLSGAIWTLEGKRVEVSGRMERDGLCVTAVHELLPKCSDLVVGVDVKYHGTGEVYLGCQPAGCFDVRQVRFARQVRCGDRVEVRMPVRRFEASSSPTYQVVVWAVEKRVVRTRCGSRIETAVRHELSEPYTYARGQWTDRYRRRACSPAIELCL